MGPTVGQMRRRTAVAAVLLGLSVLLIAIDRLDGVPLRNGRSEASDEAWCQTLSELDLSDRTPMLDRPTTSIDPSTGSVDDGARRTFDSADTTKSQRRRRLLESVRRWAPKSIKDDVALVIRKGTRPSRSAGAAENERTEKSVEKIEQSISDLCGLSMTFIA